MQQHEKSCGMKSWKGRGQSLSSGMGRHCTTHDHLFHRHNTNLQTTESTYYKVTVMVWPTSWALSAMQLRHSDFSQIKEPCAT